MPRYQVRYHVQCVLEVEADSEEDATEIADDTPAESWKESASPYTIERIPGTQSPNTKGDHAQSTD